MNYTPCMDCGRKFGKAINPDYCDDKCDYAITVKELKEYKLKLEELEKLEKQNE